MSTTCEVQGLYIMFINVLGFLFLAETVFSVNIPRFEPITTESKLKLGQDATLKCTVHNLGGRKIIWRKLSQPFPISIGSNKFDPSSKYRIKEMESSWYLTIKKLGVEDAGDYECRASGVGNTAVTISLIVPGEDNTHFLLSPTYIKTNISTTVVLPCKVNRLKKHKVVWLNQKGQVLSLRKKIINGDQRLRIIHTVREEWSLQIKGLREDDFGRYTCLVNSNPVIARSILIVNDGPSMSPPYLNLPKKRIDIEEGEALNVECQFQGFPAPQVTWYRRVVKDGRKVKEVLKHKGMVFKINQVQVKDTGDYYCTGKNGVKPLSRGRVKVFVKAKPTTEAPPTTPFVPTEPGEPRIRIELERVGERKGRDVYLECIVLAKPYPYVYWRRHKSVIHDDFRHKVFHTQHNEYTAHTKLRVRAIGDASFGDYECVGTNGYGSATGIVHLYEKRS